MFSRIFLALDDSEISRLAFIREIEFAKDNSAELHAVVGVNTPHLWKDDNQANQTKSESDQKYFSTKLTLFQKRQS